MSREIKFRAWDEMNKKMIRFDHNDSHDYYLELDYWSPTEIVTIEEVSGYQPYMEKKYISDTVLLQYTGLKDKNGVEIYEGDILAFEDDKFLWLVEYDLCCFVANGGEFNQKEELIEFYDWKNEKLDIVIVGNIYEHPHLLEVAQ